MRPARLAVLAAVALAGLAAGCGVSTQNAGTPTQTAATSPTGGAGDQTGGAGQSATGGKTKLPSRANGLIAVSGEGPSSLTRSFATVYGGAKVNFGAASDGQSLQALCRGQVDVAEVSRLMGPREQQICARNGLSFKGPIEIAADGLVLVTWNEHDTGIDCLSTAAARDIFKAGSTIDNWSDFQGGFEIALRTTGRSDRSPLFQSFAAEVLGIPENASAADVRADYIERDNDDQVRDEVTNRRRVLHAHARYDQRIADEVAREDKRRDAQVKDAMDAAANHVQAEIDAENAHRALLGTVLTAAQKHRIAVENLRRSKAAQAKARIGVLARYPLARLVHLRAALRGALQRATLEGTVGVVPFSYYELFEHDLRPLEIWSPETSRAALEAANVKVTPTDPKAKPPTPNPGEPVVNPETTPWCVFPSQLTITNGSYPLARPTYVYTTDRALKRPEVKAFLEAYVNESQDIAQREHLVAVGDDLLQANIDTIDGTSQQTQTQTTTTETTTGTATVPAVTLPSATTPGVGAETPPQTTP